jgi:hypothetical protein
MHEAVHIGVTGKPAQCLMQLKKIWHQAMRQWLAIFDQISKITSKIIKRLFSLHISDLRSAVVDELRTYQSGVYRGPHRRKCFREVTTHERGGRKMEMVVREGEHLENRHVAFADAFLRHGSFIEPLYVGQYLQLVSVIRERDKKLFILYVTKRKRSSGRLIMVSDIG